MGNKSIMSPEFEKEERVWGSLRLIPWKKFLRDLWEGKIIH
jgi:hypothetical protein